MSILNFLGRGSAFNASLGNNSAYIAKGDSMILLDCGSTVFSRLKNTNLLDDVKNLYVFVTHLHGDHVGSLSTLIEYCHFILGIKPTLISPDDNLYTLLTMMGIQKGYYQVARSPFILDRNFGGGIAFSIHEVTHVKTMKCHAYVISALGKTFYYSGDARHIPQDVLVCFLDNRIDYLYQDTSDKDFDGNPHMTLGSLESIIPAEHRNRVWCMHLTSDTSEEEISAFGFNVV